MLKTYKNTPHGTIYLTPSSTSFKDVMNRPKLDQYVLLLFTMLTPQTIPTRLQLHHQDHRVDCANASGFPKECDSSRRRHFN